MTLHTAVCDRLGIRLPIVGAGMAGAAGPELAAAVSEAGGLGTIGAGTGRVLNGKFPSQVPAFGDRLSREQVEAIFAHIKTWWTDEQRGTQADISKRYQEALDRQRRD